MRFKFLRLEYVLGILLFIILAGVQILFIIKTSHFEGRYSEYGSIANSLLQGKGFSSPFVIESGPTAWMPPFLVYLIYAVFSCFGKTVAAFLVLSLIKFATYSLSYLLLVKSINFSGLKQNGVVIWIMFMCYIFLSIYQNFKALNDYWLFTLLISLFIYYYLRYRKAENGKNLFFLATVLFFAPLISPGITISFVIIIGLDYIVTVNQALFVNNKSPKLKLFFINCFRDTRRLSRLFIIVLAILCSTSLWTIRNFVVFNKLIPIKSNAWFEFYLSNVEANNGLLTQSILVKDHPLMNPMVALDYKNLGESNWLANYEMISRDYKEKNKKDYHRKIFNRFISAFFYIDLDDNATKTSILNKLSPSDSSKLVSSKILYHDVWTTIDEPEESFKNKINKLSLESPVLVYTDWEESRKILSGRRHSFVEILRSLMMTLIPTVCFIVLLFSATIRKNILYKILLVFYITYLIPFILISHQMRYQRPLFLLQIVFIYFVLIWVFEKVKVRFPKVLMLSGK